jgi:hypothetical protein
MWNRKHAWSALFGALTAYDALKDLTIEKKKIGFGIGLHCGGCLVYRIAKSGLFRDFAYGIVANTVARLESYTKQMVKTPLLMSGHFKDVLYNQDPHKFSQIEHNILCISNNRFLINDTKPNGHMLYTLKNLDKDNNAQGMLNLIQG